MARRSAVGAVAGLAAGAALGLAFAARALPPQPQQLVYSTEGNRLRRYDVDTLDAPPLAEDVLVESAGVDPVDGRDVNGVICPFPDGSGRFVLGEDTGQPTPPAGWGVFEADGTQVGKLTATYYTAGPEPFACAFTGSGLLFTTEVGTQGFGGSDGQLLLWFPPYDQFPSGNDPSDNFCKIATDLGTAGSVAIDDQGRVYVAGSASGTIRRYSPPFPTAPNAGGGCGATDALGSPMADSVNVETFVGPEFLATFSGLAFAANGNLYASTVLTGEIREYDTDGNLVRMLLDPPELLPPISTGNPQSLALGADGTLYYADLDLVGTLPNFDPGPNGKVRRIRFDAQGDPLPPEIVRQNLEFPDGVAVLPGDLEPLGEWRSYAGGPERRFFNPDESLVTPANVAELTQLWQFDTGAIVTGSPTVAVVDVPGEGRLQVVYFQSWDHNVYAVRLANGTELWHFAAPDQPGASYPNVGSIDVSTIDGRDTVFVGAGETLHALDAVTGEALWAFHAGTGCEDGMGQPPGLCGFAGERNEVESSPVVADGKVFFGMDVDDTPGGKGGFYAVDAAVGTLVWFFDLESGTACRPLPGDEIRRYDGYHPEAELGLPAGFLATRPGCDHPRTPNGCGNVWSTPSWDASRQLLYFASSNCDTDTDPGTPEPPPPMPPYDEAIVALDADGNVAWRWRPREEDNADLAFGAAPNLFSIELGGGPREVVGVGNKDGTYYVLDRDGTNELSGVAWDDPDPSALPYWTRNVVSGGSLGGIPLTAAVDEASARIFFSTAPGGPANQPPGGAPQRPTIHALDANDGSIAWDNAADLDSLASFAPTSAIPGLAFFGQVPAAVVRVHATAGDDGSELALIDLSNAASASAPVVVDGVLVVGGGVGARTASGTDDSDLSAAIPSPLRAFCVPGTRGCFICGDGILNPDEECDDGNTASGDGCSASCESELVVVLTLQGLAEGGTISFTLSGVMFEVTTLAGETPEEVAANIAQAIAGDPGLATLGITAQAVGAQVLSNGVLSDLVIGDPGLAPPPVPMLPPAVHALFAAALLGLGTWLARRRLRETPA